ncbi:MAG: prenyltransferase [Chloroflexi bacterium]|nr:prenyltransferase [Chloroflexota bacterium]MCY4247752.1 prenyltransferase [Chloroflexota bacterium]
MVVADYGAVLRVTDASQTARRASGAKLAAGLRLSRWREHAPFTIPLTLVGGLLATESLGAAVDWRLFAVLAANVLAMCFAFMLNDVEDAPDDALDAAKRAHNVISAGLLSRREGLGICAATFALSLLLFVWAGGWALALGGMTLALCYLYSARPFRLKARPLSDVLSHALMLSGLLVAAGYATYSSDAGGIWLVVTAASLFSAYGQFYNQLEDYDVDKSAGLRNTVVLLGKRRTAWLGNLSLVGALVGGVAAIGQGLFPAWLGVVGGIGILTCAVFPWELDMRGNRATGGANAQRPGLLVANLTAMMWLASNLGLLTIA